MGRTPPGGNPANAFVAGFLGSPSMNFLDVEVKSVAGDTVTVANAALEPVTLAAKGIAFTPGGRARLGIRPQYLTPAEGGRGQLHGKVALTERLGAETVIEVTLKDGSPLIASLSRDAVYPLGSDMELNFDPAEAHVFAATDDPMKAAH